MVCGNIYWWHNTCYETQGFHSIVQNLFRIVMSHWLYVRMLGEQKPKHTRRKQRFQILVKCKDNGVVTLD